MPSKSRPTATKRHVRRKNALFQAVRSNNCSPVIDIVKSINVGYINANGLTHASLTDIKALLDSQEMLIMGIAETKRCQGQDVDKIDVPGYDVLEVRREFDPDSNCRTPNGGLAVLIKQDCSMSIARYASPVVDQKFYKVENERIWVKVQSNKYKTAICFVYMAAQYNNNKNTAHNELLYELLSIDMFTLKAKGFKISDKCNIYEAPLMYQKSK